MSRAKNDIMRGSISSVMMSVMTPVLLLLSTSVCWVVRLVFEQPLVGKLGGGGTKASHDHTREPREDVAAATAMERGIVESITGLA